MTGTLAQALSFVGLTILIVATPWAFGGNVAWCQKWLFIAACFTLLPATVLLLLDRAKSDAQRVPWIAYGLVLALFAGCLQITPLPQSVLKAISPHALEAHRTSAAAVGEQLPDNLPVSLYPTSTSSDLALLGLMASVFVLAGTAIKDRRYQVGLLGIAAANGAAFAIFGLVQQLSFNGKLYWTIPLRYGGRPFAAFVNRNHAGGYLNMCIAAALALIVYALTRREANYGSAPDDFSLRYARGGPLAGGLAGFVANLDAVGLVSITIGACATIGVVCSVSRGAILALVCAAAITALVTVRARGTVGLAAGAIIVLLVSIGMATWLGQTSLLQERWGDTVHDLHSNSNSRIDHWQDVTAVCRDYWLTGTGLGTYRYAYRPYETQLSKGWFVHAENQYLESTVEMGWLGLTLIIGSIAVVFRSAIRQVHQRGDSLALSIGLAGLFMICSQAVQSGFDFGLYMPANAILCATIAGIVMAKIPNTDNSETKWSIPASRLRRISESALIVVVAGWLLCGTARAIKKSNVESAFDAAYTDTLALSDDVKVVDSQDALANVDRNIANFEAAIASMPGHAEGRFRLAELRIQRYRLLAVAELRKTMQSNDKLFWQLTMPLSLHRRCYALKNEAEGRLAQLGKQPLVQSELVPAVEHLLASRRSCPLMHKTHFRLAELFVALPSANEQFDEAKIVQTAVRLAPNDPDVLFRAGLLDWQAGRDAIARAEWRKSLDLSSLHAAPIFDFATAQNIDPTQVIAEITPADPVQIIAIARLIEDPAYRIRLADKAEQALTLAPQTPGLRTYLEASILELKSQIPESIERYKLACKESPGNVVRRHKLTLLLMREGRLDEAFQYAAECVKLAPRNPGYRKLLGIIRSKSREKDQLDH